MSSWGLELCGLLALSYCWRTLQIIWELLLSKPSAIQIFSIKSKWCSSPYPRAMVVSLTRCTPCIMSLQEIGATSVLGRSLYLHLHLQLPTQRSQAHLWWMVICGSHWSSAGPAEKFCLQQSWLFPLILCPLGCHPQCLWLWLTWHLPGKEAGINGKTQNGPLSFSAAFLGRPSFNLEESYLPRSQEMHQNSLIARL